MLKKTIYILILLCILLVGCNQKEIPLESLFPRENVNTVHISFIGQNTAVCSLSPEDLEFDRLLDIIYSAPSSQAELTSYSPELYATHRLGMSGLLELIVYYDENTGLLCIPSYRGSDDEAVRTYLIYEADMATALNSLKTEATAPTGNEPEPHLSVNALLHAEVVPEALKQEGVSLIYEIYDYETDDDEPFYALKTYHDIPGIENGYMLAVASWGKKPSPDFFIDIADIYENDNYYIIKVTHTSPLEGQEGDTWPVAAALIDARRMAQDKIVVFMDDQDNILSLQRIDRDFIANLPEDMPPLDDEGYGDTNDALED